MSKKLLRIGVLRDKDLEKLLQENECDIDEALGISGDASEDENCDSSDKEGKINCN